MKIIEFLTPEKDVHVIVPSYCKDFFVKNKFKTLPKNIYLKKLIIFYNINFYRKIKAIVNLFLNCSFRFSEPDQKKIIILDQESSNTIEKILTTDSYLILPTRIHHFKKIYITKKILKLFLKNIFRRSLKINYLSALIELINPKLIITAIDMSSDFYEISKIFRKKC